MAKLPIYNSANEKVGDAQLPEIFSEPLRPDLISRAVLSIEANMRQPYGSDPIAGQKAQTKLSRRRRDYKSSYGHGISRVPRKIMSRNGTRMNWVGALAPGTVKGRRAHPPKIDKDWSQKVLAKERQKATRSALAASINGELVRARGHIVPSHFPFILDESFESLATTRQVLEALTKLGFASELERSHYAKGLTGKARARGRSKQVRKSVLFVVSSQGPLARAARNIPGIDVASAGNVNAKHLAPGTLPGRLTLYSTQSLSILEKRFSSSASSPSIPQDATQTSPVRNTSSAKTPKKAAAKLASAKKTA